MKKPSLFQLIFWLVLLPFLCQAEQLHDTIYVDAEGKNIELSIEENAGRYRFVIKNYKSDELRYKNQMYPTHINTSPYAYIDYKYRIVNHLSKPLASGEEDEDSFVNSRILNSNIKYDNYFSIHTSQVINRNFNYFFRYEYSEELKEVYLQGIYFVLYETPECDDSFVVYKLNVSLEKLPFFYLKDLTRKEISFFIINYLYSQCADGYCIFNGDSYGPWGYYFYSLPFSEELVRKVDNYNDECNVSVHREEYKKYDDHESDGNTLPDLSCPENSNMVFLCELENRKNVALCESDGEYQYRYGVNYGIELSHPKQLNLKSALSNPIKYTGNEDKFNFLFNIGQYQYSLAGEKYFSEPDYGQYVLSVIRGEDTVFEQYCVRSYIDLSN